MRFGFVIAAALALTALCASFATAAPFEPAGHLGGVVTPPPPAEFPEEVQLGGAGGMAVNVSGAGGVKPGTLYVATRGPVVSNAKSFRIAMYEPNGAGLTFKGSWVVTKTEEAYERCGLAMSLPKCPTRPEAGAGFVDVDVDQTTGNVFTFSEQEIPTGGTTVAVFKPDGSEVLARFGEKAKFGETTASTKAKIHESPAPGGIAVGPGGTVYIYDLNNSNNFYHRLMVFKETTPGNPKTYAYVEGADIGAGFLGEGELPEKPVTDNAGNVYVAGETYVEEYSPAQPKPAICKFQFAKGGIKSMTVNPVTGEPFFYTAVDKKVHRLSACNAGKFTEIANSTMAVAPERDNLFALAFDSARKLETERDPGVLYGAAPSPVPGSGGKGEPGMGALGYIFAPAIEAQPVVESQAVRNLTASGAELEAQINPKGSLTSYTFQYITQTAYEEAGETFGEGTIEAPSPSALLGAGQKSLRAATVLSGLAPNTAYRFRAIAESHCVGAEPEVVCKAEGAATSFATYPFEVAGPPDARAYELVSPPDKNGGQVLPAEPGTSTCGKAECKPGAAFNHFPMQSAPDGEAVVYEGTPFSASGGAVIENEYLARRTPGGWTNANLTPALLQSKGGQGYKAFDQNLNAGVLEQITPSFGSAPADYANLYRQPTANPPALTPLVTEAPPNRPSGEEAESFKTVYAGASSDLSHLIFEANDALTEGALDPAEPKKEHNLYEAFGGQLRLVNVFPDESTEPGAVLGSGKLLESGNPNTPAIVVDHAISADGSQIFWTSKAGQLYVRENGTSTTEIEDAGKFLVASADGSLVLLDDGCLYNLETKACTDLTAGKGGFLGVSGRSEDLSHLYFVDSAVLTEEPNSEGAKAQATKPNLYAWVEGQTSFVATLLSADNKFDDAGSWQASPAVRTAEASPAGRYVAFQSRAVLTGVPNVGPCVLEGSSGKYVNAPCTEVFLYDSVTQTLSCPSCNPSGAAPLGPSVLRLIKSPDGSLAQPRYLLDNGRLYFDSADALSYLDTNGRVEDVYQYEPQSLGTCVSEGGCVSLVSAGRSAIDSNFLTVDAIGANVFFTSRDRLVPADKDEQIDLYDARIGGGFPEPKPPAPCEGETCQPPTTVPAPVPPAPLPAGAGNYKPPKCPKGKVRRGGKCVKKKQKNKGSKSKSKQRQREASK